MLKLSPEGNGIEKTVDDMMGKFGTTRNEAEQLVDIARYNLESWGLPARDIDLQKPMCPAMKAKGCRD